MRFYKNKISILFIGLLISTNSFSQTVEESKLLQQGQENYSMGEFQKALSNYKALWDIDSVNYKYNFLLGIAYLSIPTEKYNAIPYLSYALKSPNPDPQAYYYLGQAYHVNNRLDDAISTFQTFKTTLKDNKYGNILAQDADHRIEMCNYAKVMIKNPVKVLIKNVGDNVNSLFPDYYPLISADGSVMVFTSRRTGGVGQDLFLDDDGNPYEDIYYSQNENSQLNIKENWVVEPKFSVAQNMGDKINSEFNDDLICLTGDGKKLYIYRDGKTYLTTYNGTSWEGIKEVKLGIQATKENHNFCFSPDEKTIYYVSTEKGGFGGKDIYKKQLLENGKWGPAENLGPNINTQYDENYPFVQADGKTLYFSSMGHNTMGGYDIFKSSVNDKGQFDQAQNMGYPVNSTDDDIQFVITAGGIVAYFASVRYDTRGNLDIYSLYLEELNTPLTELRGLVINGTNFQPMKASIKLLDPDTSKSSETYISDSLYGKYTLMITPGKTYKFVVESEGFLPDTQSVFFPTNAKHYKLFQEFDLAKTTDKDNQPLAQRLSMKNAFFQFDKKFDDAIVTVDSEEEKKKKEEDMTNIFSKYSDQFTEDKSKLMEDMVVYYKNIKTKYYQDTSKIFVMAPENKVSIDTTNIVAVVNKQVVPDSDTPVVEDKKTASITPVKKDTLASASKVTSKIFSPPVESANLKEVIKNIESFKPQYPYKQSGISETAKSEIDTIIQLMTQNKSLRLEISGHADSIGSENYNQRLSALRAQSAKNYLISKGISAQRITTIGYGEIRPIATNSTEEGRARNRRVEFRVLNK